MVFNRTARQIAFALALSSFPAFAAGPATKPAAKPTAAKPAKRVAPPPAVSWKNGELAYVPDAQGNRVPDFSYAGYTAGERPIPTVKAVLTLAAVPGDNTTLIQAAIDEASKLPLDKNGIRGAVLLPPGEIKVDGTLTIAASGVVLRGSGQGEGGTTLLAIGIGRRNVVQIKGQDRPDPADARTVADAYVPVGAMKLAVDNAGDFKAGDTVVITRHSNQDWIDAINMDDLGGDRNGPSWHADSPNTADARNTLFDRTVTKVDGNTITLDAPITIARRKLRRRDGR